MIRQLFQTVIDRMAPVLLAGMILAIWQVTILLYCYHDMLPYWDVTIGLLSSVIFLSFIWMILSIPYIGFRCTGYFSKNPLSSLHLALKPSMEIVFATITWTLIHTLGDPLVKDNLLSQSHVHFLSAILAILSIFLVKLLPEQPARRIRAGGILALVLLVISFPMTIKSQKVPNQQAIGALQADAGIQSPANAPDVVLITVDALRADHLSCYSKTATPTPAIDQLAKEGVRFERVLAPSPWTLPSVSSLICALPVPATGTGYRLDRLHSTFRTSLTDEHVTLAEHFRAAGYRTGAIVGNPWISHIFGLNQGFHRFVNPSSMSVGLSFFSEVPLAVIIQWLLSNADTTNDRARKLTDTALEWLKEPGKEPLFLWIHYIDPHVPYNANPEDGKENSMLVELGGGPIEEAEDGSLVGDYFAAVHEVRTDKLQLTLREKERIRELYALEVQYMAREVTRLLETLRGRPQPPVIAFTSDHGEEFWEHGGFEHGHDYYRETTQVPLILWGPNIPSQTVIKQPVSLIDLGPTLMELASLKPISTDHPEHGVSLAGTWAGRGMQSRPIFCENNLHRLPSRLVVEGPWRYILRENGQQELYHVLEDPKELRNLAYDREDVAGRFRALLERRNTHITKNAALAEPLKPDAMEALRSLGYVD